MKFSAFIIVAVTAMTSISSVYAAPSHNVPEFKANDTPALPDSQCAAAVEFDLPEATDSAVGKRQLIGPPDYWCCDGYTRDYHAGLGKRVCCPMKSACCNIGEGSLWGIAGKIRSFMPVGDVSVYLKTGRNCGGSCYMCGFIPTYQNFPGWASIKKTDICN